MEWHTPVIFYCTGGVVLKASPGLQLRFSVMSWFFYWNFFSKLSHTLKFVLFLPLRRKCCFYYQQLNVPKFRTTVTWIFVGFFSIFDAMISPETTDRWSHFACEGAWHKTTEMLLRTKLCSRSCLSTFLAFTERGRESTLSAFSEWIWNQSFTKMFIPVCSQLQSLWDFPFVVPTPWKSLSVTSFQTPF